MKIQVLILYVVLKQSLSEIMCGLRLHKMCSYFCEMACFQTPYITWATCSQTDAIKLIYERHGSLK